MAIELIVGITWAGTRSFIDRWSVAEWLVAVGTIGLAGATVLLTRKVAKQVNAEREQLIASRRPLVAPLMGDNFTNEGYTQDFTNTPRRSGPHVLLENSGVGPALNVRGSLYWTEASGGASQLHPLVLAPRAKEWAKVLGEGAVVSWASAVGYLRYHDLGGREWQTHFRFRQDGSGNVRVEILTAGETNDFGEPEYNAEEGWINRPKRVSLWNV